MSGISGYCQTPNPIRAVWWTNQRYSLLGWCRPKTRSAQLVTLTNEEIGKSKEKHLKELADIDRRLKKLKLRLGRHYDALETGHLESSDLAHRIRALKAQTDALQTRRSQTERCMTDDPCIAVDSREIKVWVQDLRALLSTGSIIERKSFLGSFIKKVTVNRRRVTIASTVPIHGTKMQSATREALPLIQNGSPGCHPKARFYGTVLPSGSGESREAGQRSPCLLRWLLGL